MTINDAIWLAGVWKYAVVMSADFNPYETATATWVGSTCSNPTSSGDSNATLVNDAIDRVVAGAPTCRRQDLKSTFRPQLRARLAP
jgi:hypothetical protein